MPDPWTELSVSPSALEAASGRLRHAQSLVGGPAPQGVPAHGALRFPGTLDRCLAQRDEARLALVDRCSAMATNVDLSLADVLGVDGDVVQVLRGLTPGEQR